MPARLALCRLCSGMLLAATCAATASPRPIPTQGGDIIHGRSAAHAKAVVDTIDLMGPTGSGAPYGGDFETGWSGWTSVDLTAPGETHWQVGSFLQPDPNDLAAWCGDATLPACAPSDSAGGYGNNWHDLLEYRVTVGDSAAFATVRVQADLTTDFEPGYEYVYLSVNDGADHLWTDIAAWGQPAVYEPYLRQVDETFIVTPNQYLPGGEIRLLFRFRSDGAFSGADCFYPSDYACRLDDIEVAVTQSGQPVLTDFTDFQDGTFGAWNPTTRPGVGDFAKIWFGLADADPCAQNPSAQVAFIDDGLVVPGTGGSTCITWCYGPNGYVVNTTGGLMGPGSHLQNDILSPIMIWPDDAADGIILAFDVYRHEELTGDSAGVFYVWDVRSADTDGSAGHGVQDINDQPFTGRSFVYYGGPEYHRDEFELTDLMFPGRDELQVKLGIYQLGWVWGWNGHDATPAPYFDNVAVKVFPHDGPAMSVRESDLAQSAFPEADTVDTSDLSLLHVRFDAARDISLADDPRVDPGDSIVVHVKAVRAGASLVGPPEMHYVIDPNPLFDPLRTTATSGAVTGRSAYGIVDPGPPEYWAFDLPDTGTLFPGDVLHYYIRAGDIVGGDTRWATLPADRTGYGNFTSSLPYDSRFTMRALPTIEEFVPGIFGTPRVLFWNDAFGRGGAATWQTALRQLGMFAGETIDVYETRAPASGLGNGLGGRTTGAALDPYTTILCSAGDLTSATLSAALGDPDDGNDIGALLTWLAAGNRKLLLTGDGLAVSLDSEGTAGVAFRQEIMGIDLVADDLRPLVGGQVAPLVRALPGNPVFQNLADWYAYGGCPGIDRFDAVTPRAGAVRLAEFTDPAGNPGVYPYSAATLMTDSFGNPIISLPYDLARVTHPADSHYLGETRAAAVLAAVLDFFGLVSGIEPLDVPDAARFAAAAAPNPLNPRTTISWTLRAPGDLQVKVYDVRGALVRTLHDGPAPATGNVVWQGRDDDGQAVASGVYFYEVRSGADVKVGKVALLK